MVNTITLRSTSYQGRYMELVCEQVSNGSTANSSTINWTLTVAGGTSSYYDTGPTKVNINGTEVYSKSRVKWDSEIFPASRGSVSGSITVPHNNDGSKSISVSFSTAIYTGTVSEYENDNWVLDSIPRYATVNLSLKDTKLNSITETGVTIKWSSDSTIDHIWYSTSDGSTWIDKGSANGTSGSFTIGSLSPNTLYNVRIRVRRKDSQLTSDSSRLQITTYDYPYCTSTPNFTIGNLVSLKFYNPLSRAFNFYIVGNNEQLGVEYNCSSTLYTGMDSASSKTALYNSIPNQKSANYKIKVVYGNSTKIADYGNSYSINTSLCIPTFSEYTYKDTNANVTNVIGTDQALVKGLSTLQVTISSANKMTAKNGASPSKYIATIDTLNQSVSYSTSDITINVGTVKNSGTRRLSVTAYDTRNISYSVNKDVIVYEYDKPVVNVDVSRLNNFEAQTTLKIDGTYSKLTVDGVNKNAITSVQYRYCEVGGTWSSWTNANTTLNNGTFTCSDIILSLDNSKSFEIEVQATDKLDSNVASGTVDIGEAIFFISTNKKACYINGKKVATGLTEDINRADLNDYISDFVAGYGHNLTNAPSDTLNLGHLLSIPRHDAEGYVTQYFSPYGTQDLYMRKCEAGVWGSWSIVNGIVESGSNSNGDYVKYSDGTMVCNRIVEVTLNCSNAWGSLYYGQDNNLWAFAKEFTTPPHVQVTLITTSNSSAWSGHYSKPQITTSGYKGLACMRPTVGSSVACAFHIHAEGKWK